ncbi:MAG: methyltransferase domain-containing protein [Sulfitobacter sp.]|nr:methyltransferase domain-containing protein [Sulfitobacter sp.]
MTDRPRMTDTDALKRHRDRATPEGMFLHYAAADEINDRLQMINKSFTKQAVVTGFPQVWSENLPEARIVGDSETLDLTPGDHDLVVHALALHWANDPVGQLIQCRRALRPDGLFLAVSFGGQTLKELRACIGQAEVEVTGGLSPRIAPLGELRDVGALLQRAGFALPVADAAPFTVTYGDAWALMRDLRAMGETNALTDRLRRPTRRAVLNRAAELYAAHFPADGDRITATFELIFLTGWAPDESQPKPLRPGSAQQRLSDALGTAETKLPN